MMVSNHHNQMRRRLSNVYWIGGGSGAGKSSIANLLARRCRALLLDTDMAMERHVQLSSAWDCPRLHMFLNMSLDARWLDRSTEEMLESFHWYRGEGFDFIIEDLLAIPADRVVIVEGFRLLPKLVLPLLQSNAQAVWLLPNQELRKNAFRSRGDLWEIANKTSDPGKALANLLRRDEMFTQLLRKQVAQLGLDAIEMDKSLTVEGVVQRMAKMFRL